MYLQVNRRQFKGDNCRKPFSEELDFVAKKRTYTKRLAANILEQLKEGDDDTALLHHLCKAKLKALSIIPELTLVNETHLLVNKILEGVDSIDVSKEWNWRRIRKKVEKRERKNGD